jgi:hypothetical protein
MTAAPYWGLKETKVAYLTFQQPNIVFKAAGYVPIMSFLKAVIEHGEITSSLNAAKDVRDNANVSLLVSGAGNIAGFTKPLTLAGKAAKEIITKYDMAETTLDIVSLLNNGTNNAGSKAGWANMQAGRGYDDPEFHGVMLQLYDKKYGTNNYDAETKYHGSIGALEFRGENPLKDMQEMIEEAHQEVVSRRSAE